MNDIYAEELKCIIESNICWDRLSGRRILITGASGMIGTVLTDTLMLIAEKYDFSLTVMGRSEEKIKKRFGNYIGSDRFLYFCSDICEPLSEHGNFDYIIHAASNTHPLAYSTDPVGTINTNTIGTDNLLKYAELRSTYPSTSSRRISALQFLSI